MQNRSEIEGKFKWDLSEYASSFFECEKCLKEYFERVKKLKRFEGHLSSDDEIYECLSTEFNLQNQYLKYFAYLYLCDAEEKGRKHIEELQNKVSFWSTESETELAFIESELEELSDERLLDLLNKKRFKDYELIFADILRSRDHQLSKEIEKTLSKLSDINGSTSDAFDKFETIDVKFKPAVDSKGKKHEMSQTYYSVAMRSHDRVLRESAYKSLHEGFGDYNQTLGALYTGSIKEDCAYAKVYNFHSALEKSLFSSKVNIKTYEMLIKGVSNNLSAFQRYYDIKRMKLGIDKLTPYDVYVKADKIPERHITFDEAIEFVKKATEPLGEEYVGLIERAKVERWIDVYPSKNKETGAFSFGTLGATPRVLMNFQNDYESVFTLAHELGHAMHSYFSHRALPAAKSNYEIFVAEVASTVNETLLSLYLLKNAQTIEEKSYLIDNLCSNFHATVIRQTMFAEFEEFAHYQYENALPLSIDGLNDRYFELAKKYFGPSCSIPNETKFEWSRIPHFYNSFYVYQYATGLISAVKLASDLFHEKEGAKERYLKFLSSGKTKPPVDLLKDAGVDLDDEKTFDESFEFIFSMINKLDPTNKAN